jgi:CHAD domain-containing protein
MSEPRAQRQAAPLHLSRPVASSATALQRFGPDDAFIVFAHAVLRREAAALIANKPQIESSPTPEEIHQLRVAARRLRVALRLFGRMLPSKDAARFGTDLRWFARSLGGARDLDVYTESFKTYVRALPSAQRGELSGYQLYLRRERAEARATAAAALASRRAATLLADLERFAAAGPSAGALRRWGSICVRDAARRGIVRSIGRVRRAGNQLAPRARPAELHELRIKTKRLRYELEFFANVYPPLKEPAAQCKAAQDLLGTHQDIDAALARLRRYAALTRKQDANATLPPALVELRRKQLALARDVRRSFRAKWPAFAAAIGAARKLVA